MQTATVCNSRTIEPPAQGGPTPIYLTMAKKASNGDKRILLVDDDAEIIESLRLALEARDYQVLVARDGNQGLALIERETPDLIILDMMMPKRSGFLVLERLKRLGEKKHRIIMITANEGNRHKAYAEMLGVDDYLRKPFAMDVLLESVQRALGETRQDRMKAEAARPLKKSAAPKKKTAAKSAGAKSAARKPAAKRAKK